MGRLYSRNLTKLRRLMDARRPTNARLSDLLATIRGFQFPDVGPQISVDTCIKAIKTGAVNRKIPYELTDAVAAQMVRSACQYCGWIEVGRFNGIDRVDNDLGYLPDNVVPCCRWCNWAKGPRHVDDFLRWLHWVARRAPGSSKGPGK